VTRLAQTIFALLVCATFGAFFVTQRLKRAPLVVRQLTVSDQFSPLHRKATIRFQLKRSDDATVVVIDRDGGAVRYLARDRRLAGGHPLQFYWDGRTARGRIAPDGKYRVRIGLRHEGRSVTLRRVIALDTTPPHPVVTITSPGGSGPAILPAAGGRGVTFRFTDAPLNPGIRVYNSDGHKLHLVTSFAGRPGSNTGSWDGTANGRPLPPGTYFVAVSVVDRVGNRGSSPPLGKLVRGAGRPGVTVRYLAAQAPLEPAPAGQPVDLFVDARGVRYRWELLRVGNPKPLARGAASATTLRVTAPAGPAGVLLLRVIAGSHRVTTPFAVQPASASRPVLLVLPALSWQGLNPVDDDGDGLPNTLDRGGPVKLSRPLAGSGLPSGFSGSEEPLLAFLDRAGLRYDVTTDLALARRGSRLEAYRGIVLAGNPRWLTGELLARLRRYVTGGGHVLTLGTDSLRHSVGLSGDELVDPSATLPEDAFGTTLDPVTTRRVDLLAFHDDRIGLFSGTDGLFSGFDRSELVSSPGRGAHLVAGAGEQEGKPVIAAYQLGKGLVIRTGLPEWSARLSAGDPNVVAVTRRAWTLLSR
jgi:flagellar hook assembly protein FlgD